MNKITFKKNFPLKRLTISLAVFFAISIVPYSQAAEVNAVTPEVITGTAPTGTAEFTIQIDMDQWPYGKNLKSRDYLYNNSEVIVVSPKVQVDNIKQGGPLLNIVASDEDNDLNPTVEPLLTGHNFSWFEGVTSILLNNNELFDSAGKTLKLNYSLPILVKTDTGFPRTSIATGPNVQRVSQDFVVNVLPYELTGISTPKTDSFSRKVFPIKPLGDPENFPKTGFTNAEFKLEVGDELGRANSYFNWSAELVTGGITDLVRVSQDAVVTLLKDPGKATPIAIIGTPKPDATRVLNPIRYEFQVEKWFYPDLTMPKIAEFANITTPTIPSATPFGIFDGFPTTGFKGASFKLNIIDPNTQNDLASNYDWSSSHETLARVNEAGVVTLDNDPGRPTKVTISAVPKDRQGRSFTYSFTLKEWWNAF